MTELIAEGAGADLPPAPEVEGLALAVVDLAQIIMLSGDLGDETFANATQKVTGLALPKPGEIAGSDPALVWHGPGRWLVIAEGGDAISPEGIAQNIATSDVTDGYLVVEASGPKLRALLSMGTSLEVGEAALASGASAITRFAELPALLVMRDAERALILVERASRAYLWAWLNRAAGALK